uniref:Apea-like HEPN domain-containing protein n=1 Tax=mine drainage metagenome TaxID=410659 RepID=E6QVB9_9ZZZZ
MSINYFGKYFNKQEFNFPALIHDDFFEPIKLLFQNKHYVSASKLLMIFIDSIGYIEYGNVTENTFVKWLSSYADLSEVGVSAEELWEFRNSILHMSNLDSRKVQAGKVKRLMFYVGILPNDIEIDSDETKHYSLQELILAIANACGQWFNSYNLDRNKIDAFVTRNDLIVSDNRMLWIDLTDKQNR